MTGHDPYEDPTTQGHYIFPTSWPFDLFLILFLILTVTHESKARRQLHYRFHRDNESHLFCRTNFHCDLTSICTAVSYHPDLVADPSVQKKGFKIRDQQRVS